MTRFFDLLFSFLGLVILFPFFLLIALLIVLDTKGPVLFRQQRVGKGNKNFTLIKFRTMYKDSEKAGGLTIGTRDQRITKTGILLRRYKLDELPQLFNIIRGEMSFVGPRPELRKYVELYTGEQKKALQVRPGLTDWASLSFLDENELLGNAPDPERTYIGEIMPAKLDLNKKYLQDPSLKNYFIVIGKTIRRIFL
jgi:lipopolysaccharide/colanic/teichoic acid biosynthesis glycosyltransferase